MKHTRGVAIRDTPSTEELIRRALKGDPLRPRTVSTSIEKWRQHMAQRDRAEVSGAALYR
jgi:hypothetical protein